MESGSPPPERPDSERSGEGQPPEPQAPPGPQAPTGPSAPTTPLGAPVPGPPIPGPPSPAPGPGAAPPDYAPTPGSPPAPGPEAAPGGGPVPPGGWQQPIARPEAGAGWVGKPLASWGSRVGAQLLDVLIVSIPSAILVVLVIGVFAAGSEVGGVIAAVIAFLAYLLVVLLYAPVLMARSGEHNGQSWGKQILGIRVVRDQGEPIEFGFAFLREFVVKNLLFGTVGGFFLGIPTLLDYLWPLWDDQNRCLHDMVVSTHVLRT